MMRRDVLMVTACLGCLLLFACGKRENRAELYGVRFPSKWRTNRERIRRSGDLGVAIEIDRHARSKPAKTTGEKKSPKNPNVTLDRVTVAGDAGMIGIPIVISGRLGVMFDRNAAVFGDDEECEDPGTSGGRGGGGSDTGWVGFGGWGGFGTGSDGRDSGFGFGRIRRRGYRVLMGRVKVSGGLDVATIRRMIRRRLLELKYCYASVGLPSNPRLQGLVKVAFTIARTGIVGSVAITQTTLKHGGTERCVQSAVRRWRFPKPEGQMPFVTQTFRFEPGD